MTSELGHPPFDQSNGIKRRLAGVLQLVARPELDAQMVGAGRFFFGSWEYTEDLGYLDMVI